MEKIYTDTAKTLKALSDSKLEAFHVTQPTLSHDMKLLVEAGIVKDRREGKNIYYSLDEEVLGELQSRLSAMFQSKPECICHSNSGCGCNS